MRKLIYLLILSGLIFLSKTHAEDTPFFELPKTSLAADQLAVIYIQDDEVSESVARYYQSKRNIPEENIFGISINPKSTNLDAKKFKKIKKRLDEKLGDKIQALALTWAQPYQVDCMSISAAFALGFDEDYCSRECKKTRPNYYYNSKILAPYSVFNIRPTMMLASESFETAKQLIDRGVAADFTRPSGDVYLLNTSDFNRSVRHVFFNEINTRFKHEHNIHRLKQDAIENKNNILFYFTGLASVPQLDTLEFLPGAMADHLTSYGGKLTDSSQMSAVRWLEAGATGSYGTSAEPCNFTQKFPNPIIAMTYYTRGATLIESYWKSVLMPGQGNFIGEPLAKPFSGYDLKKEADHIQIHSSILYRGTYKISSKENSEDAALIQKISNTQKHLEVYPPYAQHYRIERLN